MLESAHLGKNFAPIEKIKRSVKRNISIALIGINYRGHFTAWVSGSIRNTKPRSFRPGVSLTFVATSITSQAASVSTKCSHSVVSSV
jgi:hypothetical protein